MRAFLRPSTAVLAGLVLLTAASGCNTASKVSQKLTNRPPTQWEPDNAGQSIGAEQSSDADHEQRNFGELFAEED